MHFTVPRLRVRFFVRALRFICSVGSSVILEILPDRVVFRSLGATQSAYSHFTFQAEFFDAFQFISASSGSFNAAAAAASHSSTSVSHSSSDYYRVRLNAKLITAAFRCCGANEEIKIQLIPNNSSLASNSSDGFLQFDLYSFSSGLRRVYKFSYESQSNILQAEFSRSNCDTRISASARSFLDAIKNFNKNVEEISIVPVPSGLHLKSFSETTGKSAQQQQQQQQQITGIVDSTKLSSMAMQTEFIIPSSGLSHFLVSPSLFRRAVTFCLKEFRSFLSLCDSLDSPIHIFAQKPGKPILITNLNEEQVRRGKFRDSASQESDASDSAAASVSASAVLNSSGSSLWCCELVIATLQESMAEEVNDSQHANARTANEQHQSQSQNQNYSNYQQYNNNSSSNNTIMEEQGMQKKQKHSND